MLTSTISCLENDESARPCGRVAPAYPGHRGSGSHGYSSAKAATIKSLQNTNTTRLFMILVRRRMKETRTAVRYHRFKEIASSVEESGPKEVGCIDRRASSDEPIRNARDVNISVWNKKSNIKVTHDLHV